MTPDEIERELIEMIRPFTGRWEAVNRTTEIYHDLYIAGDDASELLDTIAARFGTSFEGLWFPTYFPNEGEVGPLGYWAMRLGHRDKKRRPITVAHLVSIIERGRWFDPEP